ncbi:interferon-induced protein with tetratricopeptide repeats 5-like [Mugil cephalus]|uniref:interferon-induced protein with tetratricopeptide repeats 5-like n=1 Tax=Mugil cephalus TaxID=48193 RepID=UPI001FB59AEC|nr:interferon-induced protein with tetratricopeptide repeats 5-like [Mugil cephalus]
MSSSLKSRLGRLQSRFTWDLKGEDMDLENLSTRLQEHIDLRLGKRGAVARSYGFLAYVRHLQGKPDEALSLLSQSEEETRECYGEDCERRLIVTYGDMAWLKYHTGDSTQSQSYCQRVEDILVKHPTASSADLHPEVLGEKGWTYLKFSRPYYPKAVDCFREAVKLQPEDSEWNAGYAIALYRTEKRVSAAREDEESPAMNQIRRALEINPEDAVLLSMLALKLAAYQRCQEADKLVERALEIDPENPHVTRYIAIYLRNQGKCNRSIDVLQRALKRSSQSAFIHHQLALCYMIKKRGHKPGNDVQQWRRQSIEHLEEAVKIKPSFHIALADLAELCVEDGDFTRAEALFQQGLQMAPKLEKDISQKFHFRYAKFHHYHTNNEADAISHYTKGLLLAADTGDGRQCAKKLKEIADQRLEGDKDDGKAFALLAVVAKAQGDKKEAANFYEKALDCEENDEYLSALCELRMELD